MTYSEAVDLARRIKQDRPDVIPRILHGGDETRIIVKRMKGWKRGSAPTGLGPPCFVDTEEDWIRLRTTI